jgi:hypothetical protein
MCRIAHSVVTSKRRRSSGACAKAQRCASEPYRPFTTSMENKGLKSRSETLCQGKTREEASCSRCGKRIDENPPFCTWLNAEIPVNLADDPECEGFAPNNLGTSKGKAGMLSYTVNPPQNLRGVRLAVKDHGKTHVNPKTACPKTPDKSLIQTALKLKGFKGSVVMEKICCGKLGCRCLSGALHGPYPYLHYYSNGKIKRRYLSKALSTLLSHSTKELERMKA